VGKALKMLLGVSTALMVVAIYFVTTMMIPATFEINGVAYTNLGVYRCFLAGLLAGLGFLGLSDRVLQLRQRLKTRR